jgi:hypothetical protein
VKIRVVKRIIPDRIFYPHPHFLPVFCLNLRKKGMENPSKSHPFYNPGENSLICSTVQGGAILPEVFAKFLAILAHSAILKQKLNVLFKNENRNDVIYMSNNF